jgi:hypothetical protein
MGFQYCRHRCIALNRYQLLYSSHFAYPYLIGILKSNLILTLTFPLPILHHRIYCPAISATIGGSDTGVTCRKSYLPAFLDRDKILTNEHELHYFAVLCRIYAAVADTSKNEPDVFCTTAGVFNCTMIGDFFRGFTSSAITFSRPTGW